MLVILSNVGWQRTVRGQEKQRQRNIIFIQADDLGYGDLGCYGQKIIKTPNLDKFASEGVKFTNYHAACSVCSPSRGGLLQGKHTGHSTIRTNQGRPPNPALRAEDITIARVLQNGGYQTGMVGKWGLGDLGSTGSPEKHGFDYVFTFDPIASADPYFPEQMVRIQSGETQTVTFPKATYGQDILTIEAKEFIDREKERPFFLYLAYLIPHAPYEIPSNQPYDKEPLTEEEKNYAAMITYLDKDFGELMQQLKDEGLFENTVVFFTSDNGPEAASIFQSEGPFNPDNVKRTLYQGGLEVPFLVHLQGSSAKVVNDLFAGYDFFKTAAEIAGIPQAELPPGLDGVSMLPSITGEGEQSEHQFLYWEFPVKNSNLLTRAVRIGPWKAIQVTSRRRRRLKEVSFALYNLDQDITERTDIASLHPDIAQRIRKIMTEEHVDPVN